MFRRGYTKNSRVIPLLYTGGVARTRDGVVPNFCTIQGNHPVQSTVHPSLVKEGKIHFMKKIPIFTIIFYQKYLSLDQGLIPRFLGLQKKVCMYYPTCSEYMKQAVEKYGFFKGLGLGLKRLGRCHPGNTPKVDLVP